MIFSPSQTIKLALKRYYTYYKKAKTPTADFVLPRPDHYHFANTTLRLACLNNPLHFFNVMISSVSMSDEYFGYTWYSVKDYVDDDYLAMSDITGMEHVKHVINGFPVVIITMPTPLAPAEAYFIGIVLKVKIEDPFTKEVPELIYFTLEKSIGNQTMMCEWTIDGTHHNYGIGPKATEEEFLLLLVKRINNTL